jgi:hypothetical protein
MKDRQTARGSERNPRRADRGIDRDIATAFTANSFPFFQLPKVGERVDGHFERARKATACG